MIRLTDDRLQDVLSYLEEDLPNCLYMYGDIVQYGLNDPNIKVWYAEKEGKINAVIMQYFQGSHVFSKDLDYDFDEIYQKLMEIDVDRISSQRAIIEKLHEKLKDTYDVEYTCVFKLSKYRKMDPRVVIEKATVKDADAIAELMVSHELYARSYKKEDLAKELANRIETGIGRSYIIRDGDRIVAHDAVNLETPTYAVEGLALVHDDYRNTLYGAFLDSFMINDLGKEGKELYCMIVEGRRLDAFVRMGNQPLAENGKLFKKTLN